MITAQREVERYPQGTLYVFDGSSENGHRYYLVENGVFHDIVLKEIAKSAGCEFIPTIVLPSGESIEMK